ncbi:restriction endonuclease subunit S [Ignatzschineria cameli]|uniref:restriction endonuclease subunit S n=1 Tax=Ignatzschineria cameli TaxID=2182793 RepID=UPI000D613F50|nr:restriction endonuclease subunit S [Ignatzschineria cameli]PWD87580.1 restriction endonuclease subunit S [Ignatzschineria cameli]
MKNEQNQTILAGKVPAGYQQTEVGIIPEDWEVSKLESLALVTTGKKNTQDKIENGLYPFFVRSQQVERINSYSYDGEGVLTAGDGVGTGKVFHYINGKFDFHQRVYLIHQFSKKLDGYYLYVYFSNYFYNRIMSMTAKSSVDSVRREMITEMPIPIPPLQEQTAIAEALSDADALLVSLEKLIEKKRAIKIGTMQQLLTGKKRLPAFAQREDGTLKGYKTTELGEIPEDWEVVKLGDIFDISAGGDLRKDDFSNIKTDRFCYPIYSNSLTNLGLYGFSQSFDYEGGYLTISARGSIGYAVARSERFCAIGRLLVLLSKVKVENKFLEEYINEYVRFSTESTGVPQLTAPQVAKYDVLLAPKAEQTAIAEILSDMDAEIEVLEAKRAKMEKIKQGMMQELLTGRTRLI